MFKLNFSQARYLHTKKGVEQLPSVNYQAAQWIVARQLCYYHLFDLKEIPQNRWNEVFAHWLAQWSPLTDYGSYIVWRGHVAQVWIWQQSQVETEQQTLGIKAITVIPEPLLYSPMLSTPYSEIRLLACCEGVEGQLWQAGILIGSRWWQQPPPLKTWNRFLREHGQSSVTELPPLTTHAFLTKPWAKAKRLHANLGQFFESGAVAAVIACVALATWQWLSIVKLQDKIEQLLTQQTELQNQATPLVTYRNAALADKRIIEKIISFNALPQQLTLFATVAEKLPQQAKLVEWQYQSGRLRFTVEAPFIDPRFYVNTYQAIPMFKEVSSEMGRSTNQIILTMQVITVSGIS